MHPRDNQNIDISYFDFQKLSFLFILTFNQNNNFISFVARKNIF